QSGKNSEYSHLSFTALAFPDQWKFQQPEPPQFFCDYATYLGGVSPDRCPTHGGGKGIYGYNRPHNHNILAYDPPWLVLSFAQAPADVLSRGQLLKDIPNIHAFPGLSGRIDFGSDGNPKDKTILMLRVNQEGFTHQEDRHGTL